MAKICIYGTDKSDYVQLAKRIADALHFHYGNNGSVIDDPIGWYRNPKAYSIFCMRSELDGRNSASISRVRGEVLEEYEVDLLDLTNYDLVVDLSYIANDDAVRYMVDCYRYKRTGVLVVGVQCMPTEMATDMSWGTYTRCKQCETVPYTPVVTCQGGRWWVLDGHAVLYGSLHYPVLCRYKITADVTNHAIERVQSFEHLLQINLGYDCRGKE